MEVVHSSETPVHVPTTMSYIPEDGDIYEYERLISQSSYIYIYIHFFIQLSVITLMILRNCKERLHLGNSAL
jgi:hypothetical protein